MTTEEEEEKEALALVLVFVLEVWLFSTTMWKACTACQVRVEEEEEVVVVVVAAAMLLYLASAWRKRHQARTTKKMQACSTTISEKREEQNRWGRGRNSSWKRRVPHWSFLSPFPPSRPLTQFPFSSPFPAPPPAVPRCSRDSHSVFTKTLRSQLKPLLPRCSFTIPPPLNALRSPPSSFFSFSHSLSLSLSLSLCDSCCSCLSSLSLYSLLGCLSSPSFSAAVAASLPTTAPAWAPSPQSSSPLSREETPSLETQQQQQLRLRHCLCVRACLRGGGSIFRPAPDLFQLGEQ